MNNNTLSYVKVSFIITSARVAPSDSGLKSWFSLHIHQLLLMTYKQNDKVKIKGPYFHTR